MTWSLLLKDNFLNEIHSNVTLLRTYLRGKLHCFVATLIMILWYFPGAKGQLSITPSGIVDVTENSRFTIVCSYTGSSTYSLVFWSKNGDVVYTRMASDCSQFDTIVDTTVEFTCTNSKDFTLTFKEVKKNQDGERWSCQLDTSPITSSAEVTIKIKGRLIFIISLTF